MQNETYVSCKQVTPPQVTDPTTGHWPQHTLHCDYQRDLLDFIVKGGACTCINIMHALNARPASVSVRNIKHNTQRCFYSLPAWSYAMRQYPLGKKKKSLFAQTRKWKRGSVGRYFYLFFGRKDTLIRKHDRISLLYICKHISLL